MSFKHLLVPLDGSELAEAVLPMATHIGQAFGSRITLLHIIETNAPQTIHGGRHLVDQDEAVTYLREIARRLPGDLEVEEHVHTTAEDNVAESLVEHSVELGVDLIIMCTHGRSGFRRRIFGSIAQKVVSMGIVPVMLISPEKLQKTSAFRCRKILVPLDGEAEHEPGLQSAVELAKACHASLHLTSVVYESNTLPGEQAAAAMLLPNTTAELLDLSIQGAAGYLAGQVKPLLRDQLAVTAEVQRGDPARKIVETARKIHADLIVLGTHGKSAQNAFWSGSVSPKVAYRSSIPLLLVPVHRAEV